MTKPRRFGYSPITPSIPKLQLTDDEAPFHHSRQPTNSSQARVPIVSPVARPGALIPPDRPGTADPHIPRRSYGLSIVRTPSLSRRSTPSPETPREVQQRSMIHEPHNRPQAPGPERVPLRSRCTSSVAVVDLPPVPVVSSKHSPPLKPRDRAHSDTEDLPRSKPLRSALKTSSLKRVDSTRESRPSPMTAGAPLSRSYSQRSLPPIHLHWHVLPFDRAWSKGKIIFDVTQPIDRIMINLPRYGKRLLTSEELNMKVGSEDIKEMLIECPTLRHWRLRVLPGDSGTILCKDVFQSILDGLRKTMPLSERKRLVLSQDEKTQEAIRRAMKIRCHKFSGIPEVEERRGMRRSDMLKDFIYFGGLTQNVRGEPWQLRLHQEPYIYTF